MVDGLLLGVMFLALADDSSVRQVISKVLLFVLAVTVWRRWFSRSGGYRSGGRLARCRVWIAGRIHDDGSHCWWTRDVHALSGRALSGEGVSGHGGLVLHYCERGETSVFDGACVGFLGELGA